MMNDQTEIIINHKELCKIISKRLNKRQGDVAAFLDAVVKIFSERMIADKYFRIRGLGSFKLITVQPRESINISTGEKIVIESFNKLHFVPDKELKKVNTSLISFNDDMGNSDDLLIVDEDMEELPLDKFDDQAREIIELLEELGEHPIEQTDESDNDEIINLDENNEEFETNDTSFVIHAEEGEDDKKDLIIKNNNMMDYNDSYKINDQVPDIDIPNEEQDEVETKKSHLVRDILIALGVSIVVVVLISLFLRQQILGFINSFNKPNERVQVQRSAPAQKLVITDNVPGEKEKMPEQQVVATTNEIQLPKYTKFITREKITSGTWLAKLSRKYYGETDFWVFIYDANKKILSNPHYIPAGTIVRIPELSNDLKNLANPNTKRIVDELIKKYK